MDIDDIVRQVIQAVTQVQETSGRSVGEIGADTRPLRDLQDFDSLCGVEATVLLSGAVGHELPDSVFVPQEGSRLLTVKEIADSVAECLKTTQVAQ